MSKSDRWDKYPHVIQQETLLWRSKIIISHIPDDVTSILELGCSTGINLNAISKVRPDIKLSGIDVSKFAVDNRIDFPGDISIGDILTLKGFEDNSFDLILTSGVLIYFKSPVKIIHEIARIGKKILTTH